MISKKAARFHSAYRDKSNHSAYGGSFERDRRAAADIELETVDGRIQLTQLGKNNYISALRINSEALNRFTDYGNRYKAVTRQLAEIHRLWAK
jgi:hypothetical protein